MNIDFYNYSGKGGRPVNEDSFICGENYFVVSDGLGGHDNGEIASASAVKYISENFRSDISNESISQLLAGADETVRISGKGGKATIAALFTDGDKIKIANVGDSRVYYFRRGRIFFRTKDHSVCQASVDMGEMTDDDVRNSADRSGLFKVLGDSEPLKLPKPYDTIDPQNGDAFLICSDGFWEHLYDIEMEADLLKSETASEWLTHMLKRLLLRSENNGDNFTAICGIINAPDKIPSTVSISDGVPSNIPSTLEIADTKGKSDAKNLIIILSAVIAVAAIGVIVAALLHSVEDTGGDTEESRFTEHSSEPDISYSLPILTEPSDTTETTDSSEIPEIPDITEMPDTTDMTDNSDITEMPDTTDTTDNSDIPEMPDITDTTETSDIPGIPDIISAAL